MFLFGESDLQKEDKTIEEMIEEEMFRLQSMTRQSLLERLEKIVGVKQHPRYSKKWLCQALLRIYQDDLYIQKRGGIPKSIAKANQKFWLNNQVFLVDKEQYRQEKKVKESKIVDDGKTFLVQVEISQKSISFISLKKNPFDKKEQSLYCKLWSDFKGSPFISYLEIEKWIEENSCDEEISAAQIMYFLTSNSYAKWMIKDVSGDLWIEHGLAKPDPLESEEEFFEDLSC